MIALVQRVKKASVVSERGHKSSIERGLLVYLGIQKGDTENRASALASKLLNARLFDFKDKPFEKSVSATALNIMLISQFTLCASTDKGRRPNFEKAMAAESAEKIFDFFFKKILEKIPRAQKGDFGAHMEVDSVNDGPVSLIYEEG
ncbi:D-tyrosyl-tRNA(Tyr) deacylase [candidate division WOR-3 bacterium]|nr:D-tyrosyl-tRNA(Tyr) deacylase [candidate division WOR-3 bacterium]